MGVLWGPVSAMLLFAPMYLVLALLLSLFGWITSRVPSWKQLSTLIWRGLLGSLKGYLISNALVFLLIVALLFFSIPEWLYKWPVAPEPDIVDFMLKPFAFLACGVVLGTFIGVRNGRRITS